MKEYFYFNSLFLSLLMMVAGVNVSNAQTEVTLWQEDFSSFSSGNVPSGGTYNYVCKKNGTDTKIFSDNYAGGSAPELLVSGSSGSFSATIPLDNIEGDLTLTFMTNNNKIKVSSTSPGITGGVEETKSGLHTTTFSGVTTSMTSITIVFTASSSSNVRLDNIKLTGFEIPTNAVLTGISLNGNFPTTFSFGEEFSYEGMTVTASFDDNTTKDVTSKAMFLVPDMTTAGTKKVTVSYTKGDVTETTTYNITVNTLEGDWYSLLTTTGNLADGNKLIVVNTDDKRAMSTNQDKNYRTATSVSIVNGKVFVPKSGDIQVLTLEGNASNGYFYTGSKGYLYAASNTYNYLRTKTEKDNNAKVKITISNGATSVVFQGDKSHNVLLNNGNIFSCYTSTSTVKPIQIYKLDDKKDITLAISHVGYATLYYSDLALKVPAGVTAKTYKVENGKLMESKTYSAGEVIPKDEAVVLKGAKGEYTFTATTVEAEKDADNQLRGTDEAEMTTGGNYYYALQASSKDGKHGPGMYWMNSTGSAFENGAHKAYMALQEKFAEAQGLAKEFYLFDDATTGISGIDATETNDHTEMYNLNGQRVGRGYKGVVIKNGKKSLVK